MMWSKCAKAAGVKAAGLTTPKLHETCTAGLAKHCYSHAQGGQLLLVEGAGTAEGMWRGETVVGLQQQLKAQHQLSLHTAVGAKN